MTTVMRHNLTTGFLLFVVGVPISLVFGAPQMHGLMQRERIQAASMAPTRQVQDSIGEDITAAATGSEIPLNLIKSNRCVPVALASNGMPAEFLPGSQMALDTEHGERIPAGSYVCSDTGKSARVGIDGTLTEVQFTPLERMQEYRDNFELLLKFRGS
jgi:hypothetical protein